MTVFDKKRVLIIGGGFAGIQLARNLDKKYFDILLLDKLNYHQFQPLFYQVAASQIEPSSISFPLRNIFRKKDHVNIRMAEAEKVNPTTQEVYTKNEIFTYDYLIMAGGCKTHFFNNTQIEKNSFTLKTTTDAIEIRNHILTNFEQAYFATSENRKALLNLVIVGAGPTGVELAGAFAEIKNNILPKDYSDIDFSDFSIYLIEGTNYTLNNMSLPSRETSFRYLQEMGIQILTGTVVKNYDGNTVYLSNGDEIVCKTLIWAAGVTGNRIEGFPENIWVANNRITVNRFSQVVGVNNVFAIGDIACMVTPKYPKGHPQVANVAINQARLLAKNLKYIIQRKTLLEYEYKDYGSMATIGKNKAVVDLPFIKFKGYPAWVVWMFLHLMLILSVRNKLIIFINWAWNYITTNTSLRLILKSNSR